MRSMSNHSGFTTVQNRNELAETVDRDSVDGRSEELHIRNFDVRRSYDLTVEVRDDQGLVFANRYHLTPGSVASELDRIPAGAYELTVKLDGRRDQTATCEIDDTPEKTALIEVGNGTVSVTEGLYQ